MIGQSSQKGLRVGAMQGRRDMDPSRSSLFLLTSNTLFGTVDRAPSGATHQPPPLLYMLT